MRILHLASDGNYLALLDDRKRISVVDFFQKAIIAEHSGQGDTDQRFCINSDSRTLTVGSWSSGTAAYEIGNSRSIWKNKELRHYTWYSTFKPRGIALSGGRKVSTCLVDEATGAIIENLPNVDKLLLEPQGRFAITINGGKVCFIERAFAIESTLEWGSFTVSHVAFSPSAFLLSGPGGELTLYEMSGCKIIGECDRAFSRAHFLSFNEQLGSFFAVLNEIGGGKESAIVRLGERLNEFKVLARIAPAQQFVTVGAEEIFSSNWEVIELATGNVKSLRGALKLRTPV